MKVFDHKSYYKIYTLLSLFFIIHSYISEALNDVLVKYVEFKTFEIVENIVM